MDFFFEGKAFDRYPLLDLTDWLIDLRAFTLFRSKIKSSMNFYSLFLTCFGDSGECRQSNCELVACIPVEKPALDLLPAGYPRMTASWDNLFGWWNDLSRTTWFYAKVTVLPNIEQGQFVSASRTVMPNMSGSGFPGGLLLPPGSTRVDATLVSWAEQEAGICM